MNTAAFTAAVEAYFTKLKSGVEADEHQVFDAATTITKEIGSAFGALTGAAKVVAVCAILATLMGAAFLLRHL